MFHLMKILQDLFILNNVENILFNVRPLSTLGYRILSSVNFFDFYVWRKIYKNFCKYSLNFVICADL